MKTARRICVMFLATAALAACSDSPEEDNDVPRGWIRQEYSASGAGYLDAKDSTSKVAKEINRKASARDRTNDGGRVFLRYRDDIVAISPQGRGSLIEIADYRSGHSRWHSHIGTIWPSPNSNEFRGGGPGSGK